MVEPVSPSGSSVIVLAAANMSVGSGAKAFRNAFQNAMLCQVNEPLNMVLATSNHFINIQEST